MEVFLLKEGQRFGPYTPEEVKEFLDAGSFSESDFAFFEGCEGWVSITLVPGVRPEAEEDFDETAQALFEALRAYRIDTARRDGVPPYVVASDRTLRDIALLRPTTVDELMMAHGIGNTKAERYGSGFLRVVSDVVG